MADILANVSVVLGAEVSEFKAAMANARKELKGLVQFSEGMRDLGKSLSTYVTLPVLALGGAAVKMAGDLEVAKVAFTTMLGSAGQATKTLEELKQFAADTPFEFPEIQAAAKKLLAFNTPASELKETLRQLGDVSAGIGAPIGEIAEIFGKARVQGRLFQEDINQLTGRGIPIIQELAAQFGVTDEEVKKLVESGKVNFGNLEKAFANLTKTGGKFGGLMAAQSQTLPGLFSSLSDNVGQSLAEIGQEIVQAFDLKGLLKDVADFVKSTADAFKALSPEVKKAIVVGVGLAAALGPVLVVGGSLLALLPALKAGFVLLETSLAGAGFASVGAALAPVAGIAAAVAAAGVLIYKNWDRVRPLFASIGATVGGVIDSLKATFAGLNINSEGLSAALKFAGKIITDFIVQPLRLLAGGLDILVGQFRVFAGVLSLDFAAAAKGAKQSMDGLGTILGQTKQELGAGDGLPSQLLLMVTGLDKVTLAAQGAADSFMNLRPAVGLLAAAQAKLKALNEAQPNATSAKELAGINAKIEATQQEVERLEKLGRSSKALAELRKELAQISAYGKVFAVPAEGAQLAEQRIAALTNGIKRLIEEGFSPASKTVQQFKAQLLGLEQATNSSRIDMAALLPIPEARTIKTYGDKLAAQVGPAVADSLKSLDFFDQSVLIPIKLVPIKTDFERDFLNAAISLQKSFQENAKLSFAFGAEFNQAAADASALRAKMEELIKAGVDPTSAAFLELAAAYRASSTAAQEFETNASTAMAGAQAIRASIVDLAAGIADAFGSALLGTENFGDALTATLLSTVSSLAGQLGSIVLASGIGIESLKESLKTFQGAGAIAAGLGLLAISGAAKAASASLAKGKGAGVSIPKAISPGSTSSGRAASQQTVKVLAEFVIRGRDLVATGRSEDYRSDRLFG